MVLCKINSFCPFSGYRRNREILPILTAVLIYNSVTTLCCTPALSNWACYYQQSSPCASSNNNLFYERSFAPQNAPGLGNYATYPVAPPTREKCCVLDVPGQWFSQNHQQQTVETVVSKVTLPQPQNILAVGYQTPLTKGSNAASINAGSKLGPLIQVEAAKIQHETEPEAVALLTDVDEDDSAAQKEESIGEKEADEKQRTETFARNMPEQNVLTQKRQQQDEQTGAKAESEQNNSEASAHQNRFISAATRSTQRQQQNHLSSDSDSPTSFSPSPGDQSRQIRDGDLPEIDQVQRFQREQCEQNLVQIGHQRQPGIIPLLYCIESFGQTLSSETGKRPMIDSTARAFDGIGVDPLEQRCKFDIDPLEMLGSDQCSFYSASDQGIQFVMGRFLAPENSNLRQIFSQQTKRPLASFPSDGFLVAMSERLEKPVAGQFIPAEFVQTKAAASLRLDIPCQLGDGLLAFDYWSTSDFLLVKVCMRLSSERRCTEKINYDSESTRVEIDVINPATKSSLSRTSVLTVTDNTDNQKRNEALTQSQAFTLEINIEGFDRGLPALFIIDNVEYSARKCHQQRTEALSASIVERQKPREIMTEPQLELFSHAEVANSGSQNHLARNSDAEKHPLSITEQQQHYKHLKGLERLSGSVDSGLMRANENPFWQIESLKRRSEADDAVVGTKRMAFFLREVPKLIGRLNNSSKPISSESIRHLRLFAVKDLKDPEEYDSINGNRVENANNRPGKPPITLQTPNISLYHTSGKANTLTTKPAENEEQQQSSLGGSLMKRLNPCELLNCSFQESTFCHYKSLTSLAQSSLGNQSAPQQQDTSLSNWRLSSTPTALNDNPMVLQDTAVHNMTPRSFSNLPAHSNQENYGTKGIFAYVGNSGGDVQENWCSRCFGGRRLQQPKLPMVYILESPAFSLQSDGELLVEMYRNSAMANAITLQVCFDSMQNCTFVGSPCQLNCRQPAQFLPNGWTRESVRLPFATKKIFLLATQWKPFSWLAIDNVRLNVGSSCV